MRLRKSQDKEIAKLIIRRFWSKLAHYDHKTRTWYLPDKKITKEGVEELIQDTVDELSPHKKPTVKNPTFYKGHYKGIFLRKE